MSVSVCMCVLFAFRLNSVCLHSNVWIVCSIKCCKSVILELLIDDLWISQTKWSLLLNGVGLNEKLCSCEIPIDSLMWWACSNNCFQAVFPIVFVVVMICRRCTCIKMSALEMGYEVVALLRCQKKSNLFQL